jgi:hypothetical protein
MFWVHRLPLLGVKLKQWLSLFPACVVKQRQGGVTFAYFEVQTVQKPFMPRRKIQYAIYGEQSKVWGLERRIF